jgi:hydroxymethylpyrimidine pyrophosphatase-like HAD family hydrolase
MKYVFDLDGTLCTDTKGNYRLAEPIIDRIEQVNSLFDNGHQITICTARGMFSTGNNPVKAYEKYYSLTQEQLKKWNVKYHHLFLGKPAGDIYIDDKGVSDEDYFGTNVRP